MLDDVLTECEQANGEQPITFFEITTVAAFLAFARVPADLARASRSAWAAASTPPTWSMPALSAITPIGYDHTGFLGDTLEGIAAEKAGILKRAVPAVIGRQRDVSAAVIAGRGGQARRAAVPHGPRMAGRRRRAAGFRYDSDLLGLDLPAPALVGAHQIDNAATAVACIERLRAAQFRIDDAAIAQGAGVGRLAGAAAEAHAAGRWSRPLPPGGELWLDGGHNEDCGIVLGAHGRRMGQGAGAAAALPDLRHADDQGRVGLPAAAGAPRPRGARRADPKATPPTRRTRPAREAAEVGLDCVPANDIGAALEDLLATQPAPMRILICGSLYLAGARTGPQRLSACSARRRC